MIIQYCYICIMNKKPIIDDALQLIIDIKELAGLQ